MSDYEIRKIVQNRLVECRIEANLTQKEVGDLIGKKPTTVASWEQGLSSPDIDTLYRLTKYYGKTLAFMFGEEE